jgi:nickel/cobalt transporter (NiCoT) family protein
MGAMPQDWVGLVLVVFILGMKHGMDPDHLATIDGMTRFNAERNPRLSRWSGCLFSLGHGVIVTLVATIVALSANSWAPPAWLEDFGAWVSIVFLFALAFLNLREVLRTSPDQVVQSVGIKGRFVRRFSETSHPIVITSVGAAFALSFDTVSQTALFSITASNVAGCLFAIFLGVLFMVGMMVTDGINGLWVSKMLSQAGRRALIASRVLGLAIGFLSLSIAILGLLKYFAPAVSAIVDNAGALLGVGFMLIVFASFGLAMRLSSQA